LSASSTQEADGVKPKPVEEQTIVITGGSSGIGLATAKMAAKRGANVVIISRDEQGMKAICEQIRAAGGKADFEVVDVGERDQVRRAIEAIVDRHGGFDTWYNCAGAGAYAMLWDISDEDHERIFRTNYWGVVYGSLEALRHLRTKGGTIINQGSIASDMPTPLLGAYTASKHAVKGFTNSLRQELIEEGIPVHVTLIKPASIHTPFTEHAKNYMDEAAVFPPPIYAPEVVADAVLSAAEKPIREVYVGGSAPALSAIQHALPRLGDQLFSRAFALFAKDRSKPPQPREGGLHRPGTPGEMYGKQGDFMLKSSLYTSAKTHPAKTLATVAAVGAGAAALTSWLLRPQAQGAQKPTEPDPDKRPETLP
jgi:NAD(P)-dependent dehydrogenase (short-subunit alcohol dehydrogenase family)